MEPSSSSSLLQRATDALQRLSPRLSPKFGNKSTNLAVNHPSTSSDSTNLSPNWSPRQQVKTITKSLSRLSPRLNAKFKFSPLAATRLQKSDDTWRLSSSDDEEDDDVSSSCTSPCNVVIMGAESVGKTTAARKLGTSIHKRKGNEEYHPQSCEQFTVLMEAHHVRHIRVHRCTQHVVNVYDTEKAQRIDFPLLYRENLKCDAFILIFTWANRNSLDEVERIYQDIKQARRDNLPPVIVIVNKINDEQAENGYSSTANKADSASGDKSTRAAMDSASRDNSAKAAMDKGSVMLDTNTLPPIDDSNIYYNDTDASMSASIPKDNDTDCEYARLASMGVPYCELDLAEEGAAEKLRITVEQLVKRIYQS